MICREDAQCATKKKKKKGKWEGKPLREIFKSAYFHVPYKIN